MTEVKGGRACHRKGLEPKGLCTEYCGSGVGLEKQAFTTKPTKQSPTAETLAYSVKASKSTKCSKPPGRNPTLEAHPSPRCHRKTKPSWREGLGALGARPETLNPQPSTLNPQPSTLNPQPSTLNPCSEAAASPPAWQPRPGKQLWRLCRVALREGGGREASRVVLGFCKGSWLRG